MSELSRGNAWGWVPSGVLRFFDMEGPGAVETAALTEVPISEITPYDTQEPYIEDRTELTVALDYLCLAGYQLIKDREQDLLGKVPQTFQAKVKILNSDDTIIKRTEYIRYWLVTQNKIGSSEPIGVNTRTLNGLLEQEEMRIKSKLQGTFLDEYTKQNIILQHAQEAEKDYTARLARYIAVSKLGLAVVTELDVTPAGASDTKAAKYVVAEFDALKIRPDDIFAESSSQAEHQLLYREAVKLLAQHYGPNLPHASDTFARYESGGINDDLVDISGYQLPAEMQIKLSRTIGQVYGVAWPNYAHSSEDSTSYSDPSSAMS